MTSIHFDQLPGALQSVATRIAKTLHKQGFQAWIVGGAVRDLVLGLVPKDIDMATNARPEIVEELFESTTAVGRAFGTIVVSLVADQAEHEPRSVDVELTTFRSEGVYKDGRHPDDVSYGATIEEDARRRDFTCNALYLDPLTGQVQDPEEGLKDLKMGRLHCVGDAAQRFQEDGLRLMRLVRFEARYEMKATSETLEGARASKASLGSVSSERVLSELKGIFAAAHPARAIARLAELELIPIALPGFQGLLASDETCTERLSQLKTALESFRGQPSLAAGLALLLEPDMNWSREGSIYSDFLAISDSLLTSLHPSRKLRAEVLQAWRDRTRLRRLLAVDDAPRAERLGLIRETSWPLVCQLCEAWGTMPWAFEALKSERDGLSQEELFPAPLLNSKDFAESGVPRGPRWGELTKELERLQLECEITSRERALDWLSNQ